MEETVEKAPQKPARPEPAERVDRSQWQRPWAQLKFFAF